MTADEFLGEEVIKKYESIYPLLRLICYIIDIRHKEGLWSYDWEYPENTVSLFRKLKNVAKRVILKVYQIVRKADDKECIFISDTLLCLDRYDAMLEESFSS